MLSTREQELKQQKEMDKKINEIRFKDLFLTLQFIALVVSIILYIVSFFTPSVKVFAKIVLAILLIIMAYNNHTYFKRKYITIAYVIFGIIFMINAVMELIG